MKQQLLIPVSEGAEGKTKSSKTINKTKKTSNAKIVNAAKSGNDALPWAAVNMTKNVMMSNAEQLAGLVSLEVVDGSFYGKMYSGGTVRADEVAAQNKKLKSASEIIAENANTSKKAKVAAATAALLAQTGKKKKGKTSEVPSMPIIPASQKSKGSSKADKTASVPVAKSNTTQKSNVTNSPKISKNGLPIFEFNEADLDADAFDEEDEDMENMESIMDGEEDMEDMLGGAFGEEDEDMLDEDDLVGIPMGDDEDSYGEIITEEDEDEFNFGENSMDFATFDEDDFNEDDEDVEVSWPPFVADDDEKVESDGEDETARMTLPPKATIKPTSKPTKATIQVIEEDDDLGFDEDDEDDETMEFDEISDEALNMDHLKNYTPVIDTPTPAQVAAEALASAEVEAKAQSTAADAMFDIDADFFVLNPQFSAWQSFSLHPLILRGIKSLGFISPTPIQREVMAPAIRHYKDVVGASQTGSGKTLSFALPIINSIIHQRFLRGEGHKYTEPNTKDLVGDVSSERGQKGKNRPQAHNRAITEHRLVKFDDKLTALILTPTRELAVQIVSHINAVSVFAHVRAVAVVGGLAHEKQERLLSYNPPIVVATPGRLWELIVKGTPLFSNMGSLRFFVLDEADRMVANGHFPELDQIIAYVQSFRDQETLAPTVRIDRDEILEGDADLHDVSDFENGFNPSAGGVSWEEGNAKKQVKSKVPKMQIFLFSATLTLQDEGRGRTKKGGQKKGDDSNAGKPGRKMLAELAHRLPFNGKPHVVDYSSQMLVSTNLRQSVMECLDEDRDVYLYSQLFSLQGRAVVFANAISVVKKITDILRELQIDAFPLHAQMQQNQRLGIMDKFRKRQRAVIVCTDVAARGLDIPEVELVIQYHVPFTPETYIHRAGRTARAGASGRNVLIVGAKEQPDYKRLIHVLGASGLEMELIRPNTRYIMELRQRLRLAEQIVQLSQTKTHDKMDRKWLVQNAEAVGLLIDDDDADDEYALAVRGAKGAKGSLGKKELAVKRKNEDEDGFHNRIFQDKRVRVDIGNKRGELAMLLKRTIHVKASM